MNEHVYMYIKEALLLFNVEVGMTETRSETMCIYHSNLEETPLTLKVTVTRLAN